MAPWHCQPARSNCRVAGGQRLEGRQEFEQKSCSLCVPLQQQQHTGRAPADNNAVAAAAKHGEDWGGGLANTLRRKPTYESAVVLAAATAAVASAVRHKHSSSHLVPVTHLLYR
jgi:hypothetical protein